MFGLSHRETDSDWTHDSDKLPREAEAHEYLGNFSEVLQQLDDEMPPSTYEGLGCDCHCSVSKELAQAREQIVQLECWIEQDAQHVCASRSSCARVCVIIMIRTCV